MGLLRDELSILSVMDLDVREHCNLRAAFCGALRSEF